MDWRFFYFQHQWYFLIPALVIMLITIARFLIKKISFTTMILQIMLIGLVAGEIRFGVGEKTLITGINELFLILFLIIVLSLLLLKKIIIPIPKDVLLIWLLLGIWITIPTIIYANNLLRDLRGLTLLFEEVLYAAITSILIIYQPKKNYFKFLNILPWAALTCLIVGIILTLQTFVGKYYYPLYKIIWGRLFLSPVGVNNTLAGVIDILFTLSLGLAIAGKSKKHLFASIIFFIILLLTNSRNGLAGAVLGFLIILIFSKIKLNKKIIIFGLILVFVLVLVFSGLINTQLERLAFLDIAQRARGFWGGRLMLWEQSLKMSANYLIFGMGLYNSSPPDIINEPILTQTDVFLSSNLFLQDLLSGGIIGLLLRLILLGLILAYGFKSLKMFYSPELLASLTAIIVGLFFSQFEPYFYTPHQVPTFGIAVGLMFAAIYLNKKLFLEKNGYNQQSLPPKN